MPNARRFALTALLVLGSAGLAGLVATLATPRYAGARIPAASDLPWPSSLALADREPPFVLLYVDSHCPHCSRAAVLADSVVTARKLRGILVTSDTRADAIAYHERLRLHLALHLDSADVLIHALGTRSVPTMVLFHRDGSRQLVVGFTHDGPYRHALTGFGR